MMRYVIRRNVDKREPVRVWPWCIFDLEAGQVVAFGSQTTMLDWAKQLNEKGYVQAA